MRETGLDTVVFSGAADFEIELLSFANLRG
jgi:hypothetical protein